MFAPDLPPPCPRVASRPSDEPTIDAAGRHPQFGLIPECSDPHGAAPLAREHFSTTQLRAGLSLHRTDIVYLRDTATHIPPDKAGIKVLLQLEGHAQVVVGRQCLSLNAGKGPHAVPQGAIVTLHRPEVSHHHAHAGGRQRMVVLTLQPGWLDHAGISPDLFRKHLQVQTWQPSHRAVAIAEQILHPMSEEEPPLQRLHQERAALELVIEAFGRVRTQEVPAPSPLSSSNDLRERRLLHAARALLRDGVSVAHAAEIAGYSSQANFSTAFRRRFGTPPKHYRNRL